MLSGILIFVSIGAFIIARLAGHRAKSIPVFYNLIVDENDIKRTGLYQGLAVRLSIAEEINVIKVFVSDAGGKAVCLGSYNGPVEYDILSKRRIEAFIQCITGNIVVIEVKLYDAL